MNNSLRRVPALLLLLLLCGCGRGGETADIRYYRLASGQSANHLANQACERFAAPAESKKASGGAIQIIPSFENELGTDASALEQCVYGGIDFVRTPLSAAAAYAPQLSALQSCPMSTPRMSICSASSMGMWGWMRWTRLRSRA